MHIEQFINSALTEDIGRGDLFAKVASVKSFSAYVKSNECGILAGVIYVEALCGKMSIDVQFLKQDGDEYCYGDIILKLSGTNHSILACERTILNILQHASGIATNVRKYSNIATLYGVKLLDTRKTRPLLRVFEKYASVVGGAVNHRLGLDDALMIKDTHRKSIDNIDSFLFHARKLVPFTSKIELECETLEDAIAAFCHDIDIIMCDNMTPIDVAAVVKKKKFLNSKILIEASGGITIDNMEEYCMTGVDAISIGSLIHQALWQDFSMKAIG